MADRRYHRGMKKAPRRSPALRAVLERLEQIDRSVAWLGRQLSLSRQTIHGWRDIPDEHIPAIARAVGIAAKTLRRLKMPSKPLQRADDSLTKKLALDAQRNPDREPGTCLSGTTLLPSTS